MSDIKPHAIYYFTIQEDMAYSLLQRDILSFFPLSDYHVIINQATNSFPGRTIRQIILVPSLYRILDIKKEELVLQKWTIFNRKSALFTTIIFGDNKTNLETRFTFVGVHFPKPISRYFNSNDLINNPMLDPSYKVNKILSILRGINANLVIWAGDFNFYHFAKIKNMKNVIFDLVSKNKEKDKMEIDRIGYKNEDANYNKIRKYFYEPKELIPQTNYKVNEPINSPEALPRLNYRNRVASSEDYVNFDHIFYWKSNLNPQDVKNYGIAETFGGSDHKSIYGEITYDEILLDGSRDEVEKIRSGYSIMEIAKTNKIIMISVITVLIILLIIIINIINRIRKYKSNKNTLEKSRINKTGKNSKINRV